MKTGLLAGAALLCAGVFLVFRSGGTINPPKYVGFDPPSVSLGVREWGQSVPVNVTFKNNSDEVLSITRAITSCGCTVLADDLAGRSLQPGSTISVSIVLDTQRTAGQKERTVSLLLDNGKRYDLPVSVDVVGTFTLNPRSLNFGTVDLTNPADVSRTIAFESHGAELAAVPSANVDWISCAVGDRGDGNKEILVTLLPDRMRPGPATGVVSIATTDGVNPKLPLYVRVNAVQDLTIVPSHVFLVGDTPQRVSVLDSEGAPASKLTVISVGHPDLDIEVIEGDVVVANPGENGQLSHVLVKIRSGSGSSAQFVVSCFGR